MQSLTRPAPRPMARATTITTLASVAFFSSLVLALPAQASLLNTVSVNLIAPAGTELDATAFTLTQAAPVPAGIVATNLGGAGDISNFMLDNERISFSGDSILIRVAAGSSDGLHSGYATGARYEISGISVLASMITGYNVYGFDGFLTAGPASTGLGAGLTAGNFVSSNLAFDTFSFTLDDTLVFRDRGQGGSYNYAEFRIDLVSQLILPPPPPPPPPPPSPVPEPGSLALVALAGLGMVVSRWRQARRGG